MEKRSPRPANMRWLTPNLTVTDVDAACKFYERAFGFTIDMKLADADQPTMYAQLRYNDEPIMLSLQGSMGKSEQSPVSSGINSPMALYLYCEDVDSFYAHALSAGAQGLQEPTDMFWGDRTCRLRGPNGYDWVFATNVADFNPGN